MNRRSFVTGAACAVAAVSTATAETAARLAFETEQDRIEAEIWRLWRDLNREQKAGLVQFLRAIVDERGAC